MATTTTQATTSYNNDFDFTKYYEQIKDAPAGLRLFFKRSLQHLRQGIGGGDRTRLDINQYLAPRLAQAEATLPKKISVVVTKIRFSNSQITG